MLVSDSALQERWGKEGIREKSRALAQQSLQQEIWSNTVTVEDDAGRDTSDLLAQMGKPLSSSEVQRRLKLCNDRLIFERSIRFPELTGVYLEVTEKSPAGTWVKRKVHLFGMESGIMPEFSVLHKTKKKVANPELLGTEKPTREIDWKEVKTFAAETRGWRTVVLRLLKAGLINRERVERHFGWTPSQDSSKWHLQTR